MPPLPLLVSDNNKTIKLNFKIPALEMLKSILTFLILISALQLISGQDDPTTYLKTGDIAPAFICKTIDGKTIDVSKLKGRIIMVNFFATWCGPCNQELPVLQANV